MKLSLRAPKISDHKEYIAYLEEWDDPSKIVPYSSRLLGRTFETFVNQIKPREEGMIDPENKVPELILPAQISAIITGPISLTIEILTIDGIQDSAPNSINVGRDCNVNTSPKINPVTPTNNKDRFPILKHCLSNSLNSKGLVKTSLKKRCAKRDNSPISVKKVLVVSTILSKISILGSMHFAVPKSVTLSYFEVKSSSITFDEFTTVNDTFSL